MRSLSGRSGRALASHPALCYFAGMLGAFNELVEQRIRDAMRNGEFDGLPGQGRPLPPEDDAMVPEDLRVAWRILKNAGFVPPQVQALRDVNALLGAAIAGPHVDPASRRADRRLLAATLALEAAGLRLSAEAAAAWHRRLLERGRP